jgi:hypothetical protein
VFGGGGGVIVPAEIKELHDYGVTRIFSPEDGQRLGPAGDDQRDRRACDSDLAGTLPARSRAARGLAHSSARTRWRDSITGLENERVPAQLRTRARSRRRRRDGADARHHRHRRRGKSSLTDELVRRFRLDQRDALRIAIISIDPSRRKSGGALLGDRIRMNAIEHPNIYMRSLATRDAGSEISKALPDIIAACKVAGFDLVIVETSGHRAGRRGDRSPRRCVALRHDAGGSARQASSRRSTCWTSPTSWPSTSSTARARRTLCATSASSSSATAKRSGRRPTRCRCSAPLHRASTTTASRRYIRPWCASSRKKD